MTGSEGGFSRTAARGVALALVLSVLWSPLQAAEQARLTVSATVLKRTTLRVLAQPSEVSVTEADVARGYVEVPMAAKIAVRSNSLQGFQFEFSSHGEFVQGLQVQGLGSNLRMGPEGGFVRHASAPAVDTVVNLGFRFDLTPHARAGVYPWPVQMSVSAL